MTVLVMVTVAATGPQRAIASGPLLSSGSPPPNTPIAQSKHASETAGGPSPLFWKALTSASEQLFAAGSGQLMQAAWAAPMTGPA